MSDFDRQELIRVYLSDAEESLALIEQSLIALEEKPESAAERIDEIFRGAHTLKGNSASLGFDALTRLAHAMEDLLDEVRAGRLAVRRDLVTLVRRCCDVFRQMLPAALEDSNEMPAAALELMESLARTKETGHVHRSTARPDPSTDARDDSADFLTLSQDDSVFLLDG